MGKSQRLRVSDVRRVFGILGDARDLPHDPERRERLIVDGMNELIGGSYGFAVRFIDYTPRRSARVGSVVMGTVQEPLQKKYTFDWGQRHPLRGDPVVDRTLREYGPTVTTSMTRLCNREQIVRYSAYDELFAPVGINDILVAFFRERDRTTVRGYAWHRRGRRRAYADRDLRLARLLIDEQFDLYRRGVFRASERLDDLPPRLLQLLHLLLGPLGQKQIARELGVTYQTVRSYTKQLYDQLGVASREQLFVMFRGQAPQPDSRTELTRLDRPTESR